MFDLEIMTRDFGKLDIAEENIIVFEDGLPGFEEYYKFALIPLAEDSPFLVIQSIKDVEIAFTVIEPGNFIKDYQFEISDNVEEELKIETIEDVLVLNIITLNQNIKQSTVNLSAPLVINASENLGRQVILDNPSYKVKQKLFKTSKSSGEEVAE